MSQLSATGQLTVSDNGYAPRYELRATRTGLSDTLLEVWQLPSTATPHLRSPRRIAGRGGRNLGLVEHRLARQLKHSGIDLLGLMPGETRRFDLDEDQALRLGLMFRVLAPCVAAATCKPAPRESRPWVMKRRPTGWAWPCTASTPGGC
jgi:hypothetical protein